MNLPSVLRFALLAGIYIFPTVGYANDDVNQFIEQVGVVVYDCPADEYREQLDQYLASDAITTQQRFQLTTLLSHYQNCNGQGTQAYEVLTQLIEDSRATKDAQYYASAYYQIGFTYDVKEMPERCEYYAEALRLAVNKFPDIELSAKLGLIVNACPNTGYKTEGEKLAALFATVEEYSGSENHRALAHIHNNIGLYFGRQYQQVLAAEQFLKAYEIGSNVYTSSNRLSILISALSALLASGQYDRVKEALEEFERVNQEVDTTLTNFWYYLAKTGYHYRVGEIAELEEALVPFGALVKRFNNAFYNGIHGWYSAVPCLVREDLVCLKAFVENEGSLVRPQKPYANYEYYKFMMRSYLLLGDTEAAKEAFELIVDRLDTIRQNNEQFTRVLGIANLYSQIYVLETEVEAAERRRKQIIYTLIVISIIMLSIAAFFWRKRHLATMALDPVTQVLNSKTAINRIMNVDKPSQDKTNALAIFDLGNFREVNRQVGSTKGDYVLRKIAETLSKVTRDSDVLGRFAPEQFILCLCDIEEDSAKSFFERVQTALENTFLDGQHGVDISIRSSMSIYISNDNFHDLDTVLDDMLLSLSLNGSK
ncbi:GGDEF domain-containing protein [Glaciecola sp. XM2]|jgi:diguanylate cyclase (GGDEF)-like protein|uniref:GGDEF domain-containing protein n=1 Tax=Glaciecola sp. XM2 TaxID=1914931 RepID=UPI001BDE083E|nr:GGDEF domain-containing protein [Glaciecola sp. XM2]MBT1452525.1 GGDEF domain-containing protein [Glaciecola sp. XM2]